MQLAGLLLAFTAIVFLTYKGWKLYQVLILATCLLAVTNGISFLGNLQILLNALKDSSTVLLVLLVMSITVLGNLLKKTNLMEEMVTNLRYLFKSNRAMLMVLPVLVSMLTVPGGAIISAPMVDEAGNNGENKVDLSAINIVFRHLALPLIPYYTPLILLAEETGLNIFNIILFNLPVMALGALFSYYYFFCRSCTEDFKAEIPPGLLLMSLVKVIRSVSPFILVIILGFVFNIYLPLVFLISILYTIAITMPKNDLVLNLKKRALLAAKSIKWRMVLLIITVMVFKSFVQNMTVLLSGIEYLLNAGVPLILLMVFIPILMGYVTGNTIAALAISMPLLLPALHGAVTVEAAGILLISAFCGYMGSPLHMCTFLTIEYFKVPISSTLARVNLVALVIISSAVLIYLIR